MSPQAQKERLEIVPIAEDALKAQKPAQKPQSDLNITPHLTKSAEKGYNRDAQMFIAVLSMTSPLMSSALSHFKLNENEVIAAAVVKKARELGTL
ncbi:MAG: hypothetical protein WC488_01980 [Candidatus Micrarchaeia archaeon]